MFLGVEICAVPGFASFPKKIVRLDCKALASSENLRPVAGCGLAYHISEGRLVRVFADWCPKFSGYHIYYPSRPQTTPAFRVLIDALRYRR